MKFAAVEEARRLRTSLSIFFLLYKLRKNILHRPPSAPLSSEEQLAADESVAPAAPERRSAELPVIF